MWRHQLNILAFILSLVSVLATMADGDKPGTEVIENVSATNPYILPYGEPLVIAHRSDVGCAPENTLMAFEYVVEHNAELGISMLEFDVQETKDGRLVLLHDSDYDGTSNAAEAFGKSGIKPSDYTLSQLQCLNLGENFQENGEYPYRGLRGEAIPENLRVVTCETILDYVEENRGGTDYQYIIEIKSALWDGWNCVDKLYEILSERELLDRVIVASYMPAVGGYIDANHPDMRRSAGIREILEFYIYCRNDWDLDELDVRYVALQLPYGKNVMPWRKEIVNFGTRQVINYAHKYDIAVQYWTCNAVQDAQYLTANGADALITDDAVMVRDAIAGLSLPI